MEAWVETVLRSLALRRIEDAREVMRSAPKPVAQFIQAATAHDYKTAERLLSHLQPGRMTTREQLAILLVWDDLFAGYIETWRSYPPEQSAAIRNSGIDACVDAITIARQLDNQACSAFYLGLLGRGQAENGSEGSARKAFEESLAIYRELVKSVPDVYETMMALTLNNFGCVLSDLDDKKASLDAHTEALALYRRMEPANPGSLGPSIAGCLNNIANRLVALDQTEAAAEKYEAAVRIRKYLAETEPTVYLPSLALTLYNFATTLSALNKNVEALQAYQKTLEAYQNSLKAMLGCTRERLRSA